MHFRFRAPLALFVVTSVSAFGQVSLLTRSFDNARSGANLSESILTTSNVRPSTFGKLFERQVDGQIYGQPLYVPNLSIANKGTHNIVFVVTMNDSVYAFDADDPTASTPLWQDSFLGPGITPASYTDVANGVKDAYPLIGIVSTPVIKLDGSGGGTIYVTAKTKETNGNTVNYFYRLHALDILTGAEKTSSPVVIQPSVAGTASDSVNGVLTFNAKKHMQRPGLLLLNNVVYMAFASHADKAPYHGWVVGYDADTLQQVAVYCTTANTGYGGIWQSGQGLSADAAGNIYAITGNAVFDPTRASYGDSFIKLSTTSGLSLMDSFTPYNESTLNASDLDLGCSGAIFVPGTNDLVGGGKQGVIYLLNRDSLGGHQTTDDSQIIQSWPAVRGHLHGSPVFWNGPGGLMMYTWSEFDHLKAFSFTNGLFNTTATFQSTMAAPNGMPGGFLTVSANGSTPGSGIVWATLPLAGDANQATVYGVIRAFDAANLTEIWNSRMIAARDDLGWHAKFNPPIVANGKVYVAAFGSDDGSDPNKLVCYGLLPPPTSAPDEPELLTAFAGSGQVSLSWGASIAAASYRVYRSTTPGGPYSLVKSGLTATNTIDTGLTNGTTYYYVVAANNTAGQSSNSNEAAATPGSLTALYRVNAGGGKYTPFLGDTGYSGGTQRTTLTYVDTSNVMEPAPLDVYRTERYGTFSYTFGSLTPGATYLVRLHFDETDWYLPGQRLIDASINGTKVLSGFDILASTGGLYEACAREFAAQADDSGQIAIAFTPNVASPDQNAKVNGIEVLTSSGPVPGATNLLASPGNGSVQLWWNLVPGAATYNLYRSTSQGAETLYQSGITGSSFTDVSCTNGTTYFYELHAVGTGGEGPSSDEAHATPLGTSGFSLGANPASPSCAQGGLASSTIKVTGSAGFSGVVSFGVTGLPSGATPSFSSPTLTGSGSTTLNLSVDSSVAPGSYPLTVQGTSGVENESTPLTLVVTTPVLAPPSTVTISAGNTQAFLSWSAVAGATSYNIRRSTKSNGPFSVVGNTTNLSYADQGLTNGTRYYYAITTLNGATESGLSTVVTCIPRSKLSISMTADAYVQGGSSASTNFGSATTLLIKRASDKGTNGLNRCTYLKIDLTSVTSAPATATLTFHVDSSTSPRSATPTLTVYQIPSTSWVESTITWSNAPGLAQNPFASTGTQVLSVPVVLANSYVSFDLTSVVGANFGQVITLQIMDLSIDGVLSAFSSRDSTNPPVLNVTWAAP